MNKDEMHRDEMAVTEHTDLLVIRIEAGSMYLESHQGTWVKSEGQHEYLHEYWAEEIGPLENEDRVTEALASGGVYLVKVHEPCFEVDSPYWDMEHGYVPGCIYLCWNGSVEVEQIK